MKHNEMIAIIAHGEILLKCILMVWAELNALHLESPLQQYMQSDGALLQIRSLCVSSIFKQSSYFLHPCNKKAEDVLLDLFLN